MADLRVGSQKLTSELLEFTELLHFALGFPDRRRCRQCLRDRLAIDLIGEPEIGSVTQLTGLMAATLWLTASTRGGGDAAGAKIAELCNALSNQFTSLFKIRKGLGHMVVLLSERIIYARI